MPSMLLPESTVGCVDYCDEVPDDPVDPFGYPVPGKMHFSPSLS